MTTWIVVSFVMLMVAVATVIKTKELGRFGWLALVNWLILIFTLGFLGK